MEDEPLVRDYAAESLRGMGYRVVTAFDGADALSVAEEWGPEIDLLLTDVVMPRMSGKALADALTEERPGIKVLFTSGYTDNTILRHGVLEEGVAFLQKPYTASSLAKKVHATLTESRS